MAASRNQGSIVPPGEESSTPAHCLIYVGNLHAPGRAQLARQAVEKLRRTDTRRVRLLEVPASSVTPGGTRVGEAATLTILRKHAERGRLRVAITHPRLGDVVLYTLASGCPPEYINSSHVAASRAYESLCKPGHGFIELLDPQDGRCMRLSARPAPPIPMPQTHRVAAAMIRTARSVAENPIQT